MQLFIEFLPKQNIFFPSWAAGRIFWPGGRRLEINMPAWPGDQAAGQRPKLNPAARPEKKRTKWKKRNYLLGFWQSDFVFPSQAASRIFWPGSRRLEIHMPAQPGDQAAGRRPKLNPAVQPEKK